MQNTANTSATHQVQLSSNVCCQLDNLIKIRNTHFNCIDEDLKKSFYHQNLMYNAMETSHLVSEQCLASIEAQLARPGMKPQAPIVQTCQAYCIQHQAVPLQEQGAAAAGPPPPPVPPLSRHVYNITLSPPPQWHQLYHTEMIAGKAPPPTKFLGNTKNL